MWVAVFTALILFFRAFSVCPKLSENKSIFRKGSEMQSALFHESLNDALREVILALGGTKKVAAQMRPEKTVDEAARWISDCLNPDRREKLDPEQVLWLLREARKVGCHSALHFMCAEAGYSPALPIEPQDEIAELQRNFIESTKHLSRMAARIEQLSGNGGK
jgi:hypothetical protein